MRLVVEIAESAKEYGFVVVDNARRVVQHGSCDASLLPSTAEVVAVLPSGFGAWHLVELPRVAANRRAAAIQGALEDRISTPLEATYFAVAELPESVGEGGTWVYVCESVKLEAALSSLTAQLGRRLLKVVPGEWPVPTEKAHVRVHGTPESPVMTFASQAGVWSLPAELSTQANLVQLDDLPRVRSEPQVAAWCEAHLQRRPEIEQSFQRLAALGDLTELGAMNLAQGRFAGFTANGLAARWRGGLQSLASHPQWRFARWGLLALFAVQLIGLNVKAHFERESLALKQARANQVVVQTFPEISVVLDAPLQMRRQLDELRRRGGALSPTDLEQVLGVASQLGLGADGSASGAKLRSIEFANSSTLLSPAAELGAAAQSVLRASGLAGQVEGGRVRFSAAAASAPFAGAP